MYAQAGKGFCFLALLYSSMTTTDTKLKKRRGRPTKSLDNSYVQNLLQSFWNMRDAFENFPQLEDIITGVTRLQTEGQGSTRPMPRYRLYRLLSLCDVITSVRIASLLPQGYHQSTVARYTLAARVASAAIQREIERRPNWAEAAQPDSPFESELLDEHLFAPI